MKTCEEMVSRLLSRRDRYIAEQKRKKTFIARAAAGGAALTAMLALGLMLAKTPPAQTESTPVETTPLRSQPTISLDLSTGDSPHIDALYDRGYTTVDELRGVTELIVRATPVSVDFESTVGRCWILRVEEADRKCPETIRLAQLKDEFLLEEGQEVVLALQLDHSTGRYYIPGGGDGLFRTDKNGTVSGKLLHSLLTQAPSSVKAEDLTLKTTFDLLTKQR